MSGNCRIKVFQRGEALGWLVLSIATQGSFHITEQISDAWICSERTAAVTLAKLAVRRPDMTFSLEVIR